MDNLNKLTPTLKHVPSQVLAEYFSEHNEKVTCEQTSKGYAFYLPESLFVSPFDYEINNHQQIKEQDNQQQAINAWVEKAFGAVKIAPEDSPVGLLEDFDVAEHIQLFDNMGE